jgi:hypothetical protein
MRGGLGGGLDVWQVQGDLTEKDIAASRSMDESPIPTLIYPMCGYELATKRLDFEKVSSRMKMSFYDIKSSE